MRKEKPEDDPGTYTEAIGLMVIAFIGTIVAILLTS